MGDPITLTVSLASPDFILNVDSSASPFILTANPNPTVSLQLGASLVGSVSLTGPSSIKGVYSFVSGIPQGNEVVVAALAPYAYTIHTANSGAIALDAATLQSIYTINRIRSGITTQIGTVTFGAGSTTGVVAVSSPDILKGDVVTLKVPSTADASLGYIAFLLAE